MKNAFKLILEHISFWSLVLGIAAAMADIRALAFILLTLTIVFGLASLAVPESRFPQTTGRR